MPAGCRLGPGPPWTPWQSPPARLCPLRRRWPEAQRTHSPARDAAPTGDAEAGAGGRGRVGWAPPREELPAWEPCGHSGSQSTGCQRPAPFPHSHRLRCRGRAGGVLKVEVSPGPAHCLPLPPQTGGGGWGPDCTSTKAGGSGAQLHTSLPSQPSPRPPEGRLVGEAGPGQAAHTPGQSRALVPRPAPPPRRPGPDGQAGHVGEQEGAPRENPPPSRRPSWSV